MHLQRIKANYINLGDKYVLKPSYRPKQKIMQEEIIGRQKEMKTLDK